MSEVSSTEVSRLLVRWRAGDPAALSALVSMVYPELRKLARQYLRKERPDHTLQGTALVHEAYLRLEKRPDAKFVNRAHFLAICAQLMRQILVEHARSRAAAKRDGGYKLALDDVVVAAKGRDVDLLALDAALNELAKLDAQQCQIVELRFFGGLSIEETAQVLGISPATVKRDWATARAWLHSEISKAAES